MLVPISNMEILTMTENEITLINLIRNHPNPGEAFVKALEIILLFVNESSESKPSADFRELTETSQASSSHSL